MGSYVRALRGRLGVKLGKLRNIGIGSGLKETLGKLLSCLYFLIYHTVRKKLRLRRQPGGHPGGGPLLDTATYVMYKGDNDRCSVDEW